VAVTALAACGSSGSGSSGGAKSLTLTVGTQTANPGELYKYVAQQLGEFKKQGVSVTMTSIANSATQTQALQSGSLDVAMSTIATVLAAPPALNLRILPGSISADPAIIANDSIKTVQDLVGKNIGVAVLGPGPQPLVEGLLKDRGVDPGSVKFVAYGSPTTRAAEMSSGQLAAAYVAASQAAQFLKQSAVPLHIVAQADATTDPSLIDAFYPNLDLTNASMMKSKGPAIMRYCKAVTETITWMKDPANKDQLVQYTMTWEGLKDATEAYNDAVAPALPDLISHLTQDNWNKAVTLLGNKNNLDFTTTVPQVC
jgi:NitT/TauT family transport system substrate-binding protein